MPDFIGNGDQTPEISKKSPSKVLEELFLGGGSAYFQFHFAYLVLK